MQVYIKDVGPITEARITIVPGVVVITGANEAGKSTAIAATAALAGRENDGLTVRDSAKHGVVEGLGTTLTIGKRTTHTGDLEVESVEDRLDLASLVDPGLKQADRRNRKRIHALISLTGTKLSVQDFASILPEAMRTELVIEDASDDPVELAGLIKRRMETQARTHEAKAETLAAQAAAIRTRLKDVDLTAEHDSAKLQQALLAATREQSKWAERARSVTTKTEAITQAGKKIAEIESTGSGKVAAARKAVASAQAEKLAADSLVRTATDAKDRISEEVAEAERRLVTLKATLSDAMRQVNEAAGDARNKQSALEVAQDSLATQEARLGDLAELRTIAASTAPDEPDPADLAAAQEAVEVATAAIELGVRVRGLLAEQEQMKAATKQQAEHVRLAEVFRGAASGTDMILSKAVDCSTLKVVEGELTYLDGKRKEPFERLSDGKRWTIAITEVSRAIRKHKGARLCVLPIQQVAWEGLDDANRLAVHLAAIEHNVCVVTAEHSNGKLASHIWEPASSDVVTSR